MRKTLITILSLCALGLASCSKGDGDLNYGLMKIYMPQAMSGGGIDNIYNVPSGGGTDTYNFVEEDESFDILMGVLRSGKEAGEAFTVDIITDAEETAKQASALGGVVMGTDVYTLPSSVTIASGSNAQTFVLKLDKNSLSHYAGKKLVLCVGIANPSRYELSENGTLTTVVVDVDALSGIQEL